MHSVRSCSSGRRDLEPYPYPQPLLLPLPLPLTLTLTPTLTPTLTRWAEIDGEIEQLAHETITTSFGAAARKYAHDRRALSLATCYLLLTTHYFLPTTNYSRLTTHYSLPQVHLGPARLPFRHRPGRHLARHRTLTLTLTPTPTPTPTLTLTRPPPRSTSLPPSARHSAGCGCLAP